jgi:hypothetical protein
MEPSDRRLLRITAIASTCIAVVVAVAVVSFLVALVLTSTPGHSRGVTQVTITPAP